MINIENYGWNNFFEEQIINYKDSNIDVGRVTADYGQKLKVMSKIGELTLDRPIRLDMQIAVGDWVVIKNMWNGEGNYKEIFCIIDVLKRKTKFSRAAAGIELKEQIIAANVDIVFLVQSLNRDFNVRRLERYLISAWESFARPVIILTKADLCGDLAEKISIVLNAAPGVSVHSVSVVTGEGIDSIREYLIPGSTIALIGSSGVGKSTLINTLAGEALLKTQEIREGDSRGRHTTTYRQLMLMPNGGLIMDTPGMRELSLWEADTGIEIMFGDIEELIEQCRFSNCSHGNEPGCAVRKALEEGYLEEKRWESYKKLQKEIAFVEAKKEGKQRQHEKQWGKTISKLQKELKKR